MAPNCPTPAGVVGSRTTAASEERFRAAVAAKAHNPVSLSPHADGWKLQVAYIGVVRERSKR
jgi:hypothetical protein